MTEERLRKMVKDALAGRADKQDNDMRLLFERAVRNDVSNVDLRARENFIIEEGHDISSIGAKLNWVLSFKQPVSIPILTTQEKTLPACGLTWNAPVAFIPSDMPDGVNIQYDLSVIKSLTGATHGGLGTTNALEIFIKLVGDTPYPDGCPKPDSSEAPDFVFDVPSTDFRTSIDSLDPTASPTATLSWFGSNPGWLVPQRLRFQSATSSDYAEGALTSVSGGNATINVEAGSSGGVTNNWIITAAATQSFNVPSASLGATDPDTAWCPGSTALTVCARFLAVDSVPLSQCSVAPPACVGTWCDGTSYAVSAGAGGIVQICSDPTCVDATDVGGPLINPGVFRIRGLLGPDFTSSISFTNGGPGCIRVTINTVDGQQSFVLFTGDSVSRDVTTQEGVTLQIVASVDCATCDFCSVINATYAPSTSTVFWSDLGYFTPFSVPDSVDIYASDGFTETYTGTYPFSSGPTGVPSGSPLGGFPPFGGYIKLVFSSGGTPIDPPCFISVSG